MALPALVILAFALLPLLAIVDGETISARLGGLRHRFRGRGSPGLTSFGHAVFVGLGAHAVEFLSAQGIDDALISLPVAIAVSMLFAWLTGIVCLRTKGAYFIRITLALGQMIYFIATSLAPFGGDNGLTIAARNSVAGLPLLKRDRAFYYVALICALATYLFCRALVASRFGPLLVLVVLFACGGLIGHSARLWRWFGHA